MGRKLQGRGKASGLASALVRQKSLEKQQNKVHKKNTTEKPVSKKLQESKIQQKIISQSRSIVPFTKNDYVMLVGEGDFSFAVSLLKNDYIVPERLIVTSFDHSVKELTLKYPHTFEENYKILTEEYKVPIKFKIDATNLIKTLKVNAKNITTVTGFPRVDFIMFNFPHTGRGIKDQDRNIRDHQVLVDGYFKSSVELFKLYQTSSILKSKTSDLNLVGSTSQHDPKIILSVFEGQPYDSWNVKSLSKGHGLKVERSGDFQWDKFEGYSHKRTNSEQNTTKVASERKARMYVFEKYRKQQEGKKGSKDDDEDDSDSD
ncbi:hypothetical protein WICPIJ_004496 [Wickerhamomyces pijperi]|uniref:25S rRNA (uridine-N(3))-methyltransferase BMT5-like domain-containing protein n=1 Tax=Wickerhamomyces pijperi TaxID=599730 RepID=A0A9P8Q7I7_WICPI|nr:hypothetical protein WICPIJ_004496 [Wickerhamomyces pijperi]